MPDTVPSKVRAAAISASPRRVIWVNRFFHPDESATSIMLTDLLRAIANGDGPQHHVISSKANYATHEGNAKPLDHVITHRVPAIGSNNKSLLVRLVNFFLFYVGSSFLLLRYLRRSDVVVTLTDPPLIGVIAAAIARMKGGKCVHWVQDIFPETATRLGYAKEGGMLERILRSMRNWSWKNADASVVIGDRMRDYLTQNEVEHASITVVQNWAGDEAITPVEHSVNPIRREWQYSTEECVVGYSGNLGRAHDVATMIAAKRIVHSKGSDRVRFLYIGGGAKQDQLRQAANELPDELVSFRPYQPMAMLRESLSVPDVHWISLLPALEGLIVPSKLYGALAVGRPIVFIGDKEGEVARLLKEGECGASFDIGESEALAEYLSQLSQDPAMRQQLGANGRAYLDAELRRQKRMDQWRAQIEKLLG